MSDRELMAPLKWEPPIILEAWGRKARVVTQADVDRWLNMEHKYIMLVDALKAMLDDARLRDDLEKPGSEIAKAKAGEMVE